MAGSSQAEMTAGSEPYALYCATWVLGFVRYRTSFHDESALPAPASTPQLPPAEKDVLPDEPGGQWRGGDMGGRPAVLLRGAVELSDHPRSRDHHGGPAGHEVRLRVEERGPGGVGGAGGEERRVVLERVDHRRGVEGPLAAGGEQRTAGLPGVHRDVLTVEDVPADVGSETALGAGALERLEERHRLVPRGRRLHARLPGEVGPVDERVGVGVPGHRVGDVPDHAGGPEALEEARLVDEAVRDGPQDRRVEELRLGLGEELREIGPLARRDRRLELGVVLAVRDQRHLHGDVGVRGLEGLDDLVEHIGVALGGPDGDGAGGRRGVDGRGGGCCCGGVVAASTAREGESAGEGYACGQLEGAASGWVGHSGLLCRNFGRK